LNAVSSENEWAQELSRDSMNAKLPLCVVGSLLFSLRVYAQAPARGGDFAVTKINRNLITSPQFTYTGAQQYVSDQRNRWLEVEVEFTALPEYTDELTCKYYILVNGKLLVGEVTHVNIAGGRDLRSVMYVSPKTLMRLMGKQTVGANAVQNIAVQLVQQGAVKSELSQDPGGGARWFSSIPQVTGLVLNKNETPFAPLYWDRYEQIKAPTR
jgi:hypothetical protein